VGFTGVERRDERPVGIQDCAHYPLFTPGLLDLMRRHLPPERHACVARSVVFVARKAGRPRAGP
jgi:arsenite methyltransferase